MARRHPDQFFSRRGSTRHHGATADDDALPYRGIVDDDGADSKQAIRPDRRMTRQRRGGRYPRILANDRAVAEVHKASDLR